MLGSWVRMPRSLGSTASKLQIWQYIPWFPIFILAVKPKCYLHFSLLNSNIRLLFFIMYYSTPFICYTFIFCLQQPQQQRKYFQSDMTYENQSMRRHAHLTFYHHLRVGANHSVLALLWKRTLPSSSFYGNNDKAWKRHEAPVVIATQ